MYPNKEALLQADRFTFGDGTAVMLLEQVDHAPPLDTYLYAEGSGFKYLFNSNYSIRNAWRNYERYLTPDGTPHGKRDLGYSYYYMNGFYITLFASKNMSDQIKQIWGDQISAYDYFAFHQGNKQIMVLERVWGRASRSTGVSCGQKVDFNPFLEFFGRLHCTYLSTRY